MSLIRNLSEKLKNINCIQKERGAIFVLTALLLPIMFGCLGIAYDVGTIYMHKSRLQNVADAAALAGGRAYIESQAKTTGTKDDIDEDENHTGHGVKNPYTYTIAGINNRTGIDGITYGNSRKHADADKAADDYIYKNIINLGETVKADRYSHFALKGIKKNADAEGEETTYTSTDDVFYRVGLEETVPLHFLPVITNKNAETVRAGSVVLVQPGTTTVIPGSGGGSTTVTNPSIFDNLFTYSMGFDSAVSNEQGKLLHASYSGNMVFTYGDSDPDKFYDMTLATTNFVDHLFTDKDADNLKDTDSPSYNWSKVNDPLINTYFKTTAYIDAFKSWLNEPHIEITNQNKNSLTSAELIDPNSSLYLTEVSGTNGETVYVSKNGTLFINSGDTYYGVDEDGKYLYATSGIETYQICYRKYMDPINGNDYLPCVYKDGKYYVVSKDRSVSNCYLNTQDAYVYYEGTKLTYDETNQDFYFNGQAQNLSSLIKNDNFKDYQQRQNRYTKKIETNIIHFNNTCNLNVTINNTITPVWDTDTENTPIYIIIENTVNLQNFNCNVDNPGRPLIFVYLGSSTIQLQTGNFNGVIYAPYADIYINLSGTFQGNIIAKNLTMQASGSAGATFIQKNYLESSDSNGYNDEKIAAVTQTIEEEIRTSQTLPDNIKSDIYAQYASALGIYVQDMDDANWYSKQSYENKQKLYNTWKTLYANYPDYANQLWPWNEHFNIESGEDQTVTTDETLRLINYRTEYQVNEDGSIPENKVLDPFIFVSLEQPDSY